MNINKRGVNKNNMKPNICKIKLNTYNLKDYSKVTCTR